MLYTSEHAAKSCYECGAPLKGRVDKKFCSDQCRSTYNNKLKIDDNLFVKAINNVLRKNRRILMHLNPGGKNKVSRDTLLANGFDFNYFTSMYTTREGTRYFYCYEHGYLPIEKDWYLLVIRKESHG